MSTPLLTIEDVVVELPTPRGNLRAVDHVDLSLEAGRTLGIVGESGCGKTMLSRAILQLLPKKAKLTGRVMFDGQDLVRLAPESLRRLRARDLAVVFQDPMTSLNPVLTIGTQLMETIQEHLELDAPAARKRSIELLAAVGIPAPEQRLAQYPHQCSGGMRQRIAIAIATRWRMPPESWCGYCASRCSGAGMPTAASNSMLRLVASARPSSRCS